MKVGFYDHDAQWDLLGDQFVDLFRKFGKSTKYVDGPLIAEFEEKLALRTAGAASLGSWRR